MTGERTWGNGVCEMCGLRYEDCHFQTDTCEHRFVLPPNLRYPSCSECGEKPGIIQVKMRGAQSAPYCADCAAPLVRSRKIASFGASKPVSA